MSAPPLGSGGRFAAIEKKAAAGGARDPAAVAAAAGMKKYGAHKMSMMAHHGTAAAGLPNKPDKAKALRRKAMFGK